jgi:hypothetical protein
MFTVGATDLYIHKYTGIKDSGPSKDLTQPQHDSLDPTNIQDLLFLENRDRKYDQDIYRLRGHYNVQNLDFDLSQFGLFLNNDVIFISVHYNDMIELIGRKLMVGDVIELPHLTDYHPLNEAIPIGLRRYYQITDGNFASEGFSPTWYAHLWRIKCEPLVDSQEFSNILEQPINTDNYLGDWNKDTTYLEGYVVTYGDKNYTPKDGASPIPPGTPCTDTDYWELDTADSLKDILGRYNKNIEINNAIVNEAARILPKSGYDTSNLYVVPTMPNNAPANPINVIVSKVAPIPTRGELVMMGAPGYKPSPVIRINRAVLQKLNNGNSGKTLLEFMQTDLTVGVNAPNKTSTGSGRVNGDKLLVAESMGLVTGPYGTVDNMYSTADQDPVEPNFTGTIIQDIMDYRADTDPRFRFIARYSPRSFGYLQGYLTGDGTAPNGLPTGAGTSFPSTPKVGDYFLRLDYLPQQLFRWDGALWLKISENVRTGVGFDEDNQSQLSSFINNSNVTPLSNGTTMPERQSLSEILRIQTD